MEILARAVGRRKEAVAQVQIVKGTGKFLINNKKAEEYLQNNISSLIAVKSSFDILNKNFNLAHNLKEGTIDPSNNGSHVIQLSETEKINNAIQIDTIVKVKGGGIIGQSDAIKLGIARAICDLVNSNLFKDRISTLSVSSTTENTNSAPVPNTLTLQTNILENQVQKSDANKQNQNSDITETLQKITTIRKQLKTKGYLTQDSRVKERRKYGLRKARKAPQYHKR